MTTTTDFNFLPPMILTEAPNAFSDILALKAVMAAASVPPALLVPPAKARPTSITEAMLYIAPALPRVRGVASLINSELPPPSEEQERAIQLLCKHDKVVKRLSGKAGTGKSTVIRHVQQRVTVSICATTAKAALNVGGVTLDRLFNYDRTRDDMRSEKKLRENMENCADIIVIDEASMIGRKMANYVHRVAIMYNKTLILVGDWAQARPVKDEWITQSSILAEAVTVFLTESHRQTDKPFLDALNALSVGATDHPSYKVFDACKVRREPDGDHYVRLYATNQLTGNYNRSRLAELPDIAPKVPLRVRAYKTQGAWYDGEEDRLIDDTRFIHQVSVKLGSRLMVTKNEHALGIVNGDAGELIDVGFLVVKGHNSKELQAKLAPAPTDRPDELNGEPIVCWLSQFTTPEMKNLVLEEVEPRQVVLLMKHDRTGEEICIPNSTREIIDANDAVLFTFHGFPVMLGWAITIHKAQGATCDHVYVDMSSIMQFPAGSRHGLAYVALSRARTPEGLKIFGWNPAAIECDSEVWCLLAPPPPVTPPTQE